MKKNNNQQAHGGPLQQLIVTDDKTLKLLYERMENAGKLILSKRQLCDLELLLNGGFSPLSGFMEEADYEKVVSDMHLMSGALWPIPITLDVQDGKKFKLGQEILLTDQFNQPYALMTISSIFKPDKKKEAKYVFGTSDMSHTGVANLLRNTNNYYLGGKITGIKEVGHYDFLEYRQTPIQLRKIFKKLGFKHVIGFQTRNPLHKVHYQLMKDVSLIYNGHILLHPSVGKTNEGDIDYITRTKSYIQVHKKYMHSFTYLSLLPLAMRMAGPREAMLHAIIRMNYGCTHFIVGRNHASPASGKTRRPFYGDYEAHDLIKQYENELSIIPVLVKEMVYVKELNKYVTFDKVLKKQTVLKISGTQIRDRLAKNEPLPEWLAFPEVVEELKNAMLRKTQKGLTIFFTGLPSSGKSTLARTLQYKLIEILQRDVTLLDGDVVRANLSQGLGFSKKDRMINIARIGFVAKEITKHKGYVICAAVAPYEKVRLKNRKDISLFGNYVEIYLSTPLKTCQKRDVKGLYRKARLNKLANMTGVDDVYEPPRHPELKIDTTNRAIGACVDQIMHYLASRNLLS